MRFIDFYNQVLSSVYPDKDSPRLDVRHRNAVIDALIRVQRYAACNRSRNKTLYLPDDTRYVAGCSVMERPVGQPWEVRVERVSNPDDFVLAYPYTLAQMRAVMQSVGTCPVPEEVAYCREYGEPYGYGYGYYEPGTQPPAPEQFSEYSEYGLAYPGTVVITFFDSALGSGGLSNLNQTSLPLEPLPTGSEWHYFVMDEAPESFRMTLAHTSQGGVPDGTLQFGFQISNDPSFPNNPALTKNFQWPLNLSDIPQRVTFSGTITGLPSPGPYYIRNGYSNSEAIAQSLVTEFWTLTLRPKAVALQPYVVYVYSEQGYAPPPSPWDYGYIYYPQNCLPTGVCMAGSYAVAMDGNDLILYPFLAEGLRARVSWTGIKKSWKDDDEFPWMDEYGEPDRNIVAACEYFLHAEANLKDDCDPQKAAYYMGLHQQKIAELHAECARRDEVIGPPILFPGVGIAG